MHTHKPFITFTLPVGAEYKTMLLNVQHANNQLCATVEVKPEVWEHIDLIMMFNLGWDVRNAGSISGTQAVQIKMFLDTNIYTTLQAENNLLTDEQAFLSSDKKHIMRSAKSWFATEVTEEVELPEELKGSGTLREGFTTIWRDTYN